jgi:hypothetical protein
MPLKRVLLFAAEVAVLFFGFVFSLGLARYFDCSENNAAAAAIAFFFSLFLTVAGLLVLRCKTRRWKIKQDAASWVAIVCGDSYILVEQDT